MAFSAADRTPYNKCKKIWSLMKEGLISAYDYDDKNVKFVAFAIRNR